MVLFGLQLMFSSLFGSSVKAKVDDTNVVRGDSVELVLEVEGDSVEFPNITMVGDYQVQRVSSLTKSAYKIINNQSSAQIIKQQTITFTPDKNMTIPSFEIVVDGQKLHTNPIELTISKSSAPSVSSKFNLTMLQSKDKIYLGEPILLSIYFSVEDGVDLMDFRSEQPQLQGFIVKEIKGEKSYRKDNYSVHEFRYLITPTRDGNITIPPIRAQVAQRSRARDNFFGTFFDKPKWSQIESNGLNLIVKPLLKGSELIGDFTISEKIDATEVKSNKPVNLTIGILGEGNLEDFDGVNYEIDGVTIYSDDAKVSSRLVGSKMISRYEKKFVFISDHNFTIPSVELSSFNYKTQKLKNLTIESHNITVKGGAKSLPVTVQSASPTITPKETTPLVQDRSIIELWMLVASFLAGVLSTLLFIKLLPLLSLKSTNPMRESQALKILYPHTNDNIEVENMVRDLYAKKGGDRSIKIDKVQLKKLITEYLDY